MIYSVSTTNLILDKETAKQNFPMIKEAGFSAVDLSFDTIFSKTGGNVWRKPFAKSVFFDMPENEFFDYLDGIKKEAEKNGIKIAQCHAPFPSYCFGDDGGVNEYLVNIIKKSISAAGYLGCPYIVIHPVNFPYGGNTEKSEIFDANIKFYSQFIDELKKYNVVACLENMWVIYNKKIFVSDCNDFDEVNRYIEVLNEKAGAECFAFCLDTGHSVLTSTNIRFAIKTLGKNLKVIHLHEVDGINDRHTMPYTQGAVDWDYIMSALRDYGYKGTLNFEAANSWLMFPQELWPQALKMLGAIGKYFCDKYF